MHGPRLEAELQLCFEASTANRRTSDGPVDLCSILQFYRHSLVVKLHPASTDTVHQYKRIIPAQHNSRRAILVSVEATYKNLFKISCTPRRQSSVRLQGNDVYAPDELHLDGLLFQLLSVVKVSKASCRVSSWMSVNECRSSQRSASYRLECYGQCFLLTTNRCPDVAANMAQSPYTASLDACIDNIGIADNKVCC